LEKHVQRNLGAWPLMLTGLGSIIGSGWLFGAGRAAHVAGPAAIFTWIIGAVVILAIALTYAELGAMFPESGGMVRYARYSHGSLVGFVAAWANWIAIVTVIPVEAEASKDDGVPAAELLDRVVEARPPTIGEAKTVRRVSAAD